MLASEHNTWTSYAVQETDAPVRWGDLRDGCIRLRDDGVDAWPHALVSPNTFWFFFPRVPCPDRPWEHALVRHLQEECTILNSHPVVHLFVARSHMESYGTWTAVALQTIDNTRLLLTLHRRVVQPAPTKPPLNQAPFHVRVYEHYLRRNVPDGWSLCHEERNGPSVVNGRRYHMDPLKCDLVLTRGCQRVCVVCVPTENHISTHPLSRCTHLRDRMLCRVVLVFGTPPDLEWLDFRYPDDAGEPTRHRNLDWLHHIDEVRCE